MLLWWVGFHYEPETCMPLHSYAETFLNASWFAAAINAIHITDWWLIINGLSLLAGALGVKALRNLEISFTGLMGYVSLPISTRYFITNYLAQVIRGNKTI